MYVIARQEFELAYIAAAVQRFNHGGVPTPLRSLIKFGLFNEILVIKEQIFVLFLFFVFFSLLFIRDLSLLKHLKLIKNAFLTVFWKKKPLGEFNSTSLHISLM